MQVQMKNSRAQQWVRVPKDLSIPLSSKLQCHEAPRHYCTVCGILDSWTNCCEEWARELPSAQIPVNHIPRLVATQWNLLFTIQLFLDWAERQRGRAPPSSAICSVWKLSRAHKYIVDKRKHERQQHFAEIFMLLLAFHFLHISFHNKAVAGFMSD